MQAGSLRATAIVMLASAAVVICGCAANPSSQGAGAAPNRVAAGHGSAALPGKPGCFWLSNFDGSWTVLNDSELIVYAPLYSQPYLVKLFEPVPTLKFRERLGFVDVEHTGMICDGTLDSLLVPHWQPHRVPIVAVRELTAPEAAHLLAENHIKVPARLRPAKGDQAATH